MALSACAALFVSTAFSAAAVSQETSLAYRDFGVVQRMRVVCSQKHFGRIQDLVVDIPSGRLSAAIVSMVAEDKEITSVVVPYEKLHYDPQTNLLRLGTCLEHDHDFPLFDPEQIRIVGRQGDGDGELRGTTLLSRLATSQVALAAGTARAHEATVELTSGHVAFLDLATGKGRVGDPELHPVPWSATSFLLADADKDQTPLLSLPIEPARLAEAPTLLEIIVQDPNYRGLVYTYFKAPRPAFDTEG